MAQIKKKPTTRKKTSKKARTKPPLVDPRICEVCGRPAVADGRCLAHAVVDILTDGARKAERRDDTIAAAVWKISAAFANYANEQDLAKKAAFAYAMHRQQRAQQAQQQAQQAKVDPFDVLGLPPTATKADVRMRQKQLAAIFHPDKGGGEYAERKLQEINAAVDEALKRCAA
jgi:hypothetical protein